MLPESPQRKHKNPPTLLVEQGFEALSLFSYDSSKISKLFPTNLHQNLVKINSPHFNPSDGS